MKKLVCFIFVCGVLIAVITGQPANVSSQSDNYKTYANARFKYSVSYPANLLKPQGESANGDGQSFLAKDGSAEMRVYGGYNTLNETLRGKFAELTRKWGSGVTYKAIHQEWFVVSALVDGKTHYQKTILRGDTFKTLEIEYNSSRRATYDAPTSRISKSFQG